MKNQNQRRMKMKEILNEWRKFIAETNRLGMFPSKGGFKKAQKAAMMYSPEEQGAFKAGARGEDDTEYKDFGEDYYIKSMDSISYEEAEDFLKVRTVKYKPEHFEAPEGKEFYKIEMNDGEILIAVYDLTEKDMRVYDENEEEAGEEYDWAALDFIQQDLPYDQERFPEDE